MTTTHAYPPALIDVLRELDSETYDSFTPLEGRVRELMMERSRSFPVGYSLDRALDDAAIIGAIIRDDATGRYSVALPG